jgi:hypothetical protein
MLEKILISWIIDSGVSTATHSHSLTEIVEPLWLSTSWICNWAPGAASVPLRAALLYWSTSFLACPILLLGRRSLLQSHAQWSPDQSSCEILTAPTGRQKSGRPALFKAGREGSSSEHQWPGSSSHPIKHSRDNRGPIWPHLDPQLSTSLDLSPQEHNPAPACSLC